MKNLAGTGDDQQAKKELEATGDPGTCQKERSEYSDRPHQSLSSITTEA